MSSSPMLNPLNLMLTASLWLALPAFAQETVDFRSMIRNQKFGVIRGERSIQLAGGVNYIRFEDLAAGIKPKNISFRSFTMPSSAVSKQSYGSDLIYPHKIVEFSRGFLDTSMSAKNGSYRGHTFDLVVERRKTDGEISSNGQRESYQIDLHNYEK